MKTKMIKKIITIVVATILFSACGVYTNYQRPADIQSKGLVRQVIAREDSVQPKPLVWRDIFTDPKLQVLIEKGLLQNADIRTARLKTVEAEASLKAARQAFLPGLSLTPQGSLTSFNGEHVAATYNFPVAASWQIDIFGSLQNAKKRHQALVENSKAYTQAVQSNLVATIATNYYTLSMLDAQLRVLEQTVENWRNTTRVMQSLMSVGQYNSSAVLQSESNYLTANASVIEVKQSIIETENNLSVLVGDSIHSIERNDLSSGNFPTAWVHGIPLALTAERPDVKQAELNLKAAFYSVNEAKSAFYPSITLTGSGGWTNNAGAFIVNPGAMLLSAVGAISQPIFQNGKLKAQLKIAQAQQEEAKIAFQQTLYNAGKEVNNALMRYQSYQQKDSIYTRQVEALGQAVKATELLMQHGSTTYLEILTALQSQQTAQINHIVNNYNQTAALISLFQTLGIK